MRGIVLLGVIGLGLSMTGRAKADALATPPLPPAKESVTVKIEMDEKAKGPRLVVPNGVFTEPPARRPKGPKPGKSTTMIERDGADGIADNDNPSRPGNHILIAGVAFAMSMAFGGLWLLRKNGKGSIRGLTLLIAAGATLTAGAIVWADAAPMPDPRYNDPPVAKIVYPSAYEAKASVEFFYGDAPVRLILDKESYEKLKKGELKEVPAKTK